MLNIDRHFHSVLRCRNQHFNGSNGGGFLCGQNTAATTSRGIASRGLTALTNLVVAVGLVATVFVATGSVASAEIETASDTAPAKPNIVLILVDDLGWSDLACYGSDFHETPNLDRLATQGVRFTDAYAASPVCTPTRAAILTGRHPARLHMTIWREAALSRGDRQLLQPICVDSLPASETTFAEILKSAGYYNVHLGKWHVGRPEGYPQVHGFQRNIGGTLWGAPQTFWYPFNGDAYFSDWRYVPDLEPGKSGDYLTDVLTDRALELMEQQVESQQPFFINLWYHTVHTPIEGKPEYVEHYARKINDAHLQRNPIYAAMVQSLDENVGRVLAKLDELGIADDTLVVFTSDNGGFVNDCKLNKNLPVANNSPLRSGKGSCYEGGIRVPLLVRGPIGTGKTDQPAFTARGKICNEPVVACDLFPTLLDAVGLDFDPGLPLDGRSLVPLLADPNAILGRNALCFHYPHYYPTTTPVSAIRRGSMKLLQYYEDSRVELYDLDADLSEEKNLAQLHPDIADALQAELRAWLQEVGGLMPEPNPNWPGNN